MHQILRLDLIPELVVDLPLEAEDIVAEVQVHDLRLRLRFEDPPQVLQMLDLAVEEELVVRELVILIAGHITLDLKGHAKHSKMTSPKTYLASTMKNSLVLITLNWPVSTES
jgi:hypothetical protein